MSEPKKNIWNRGFDFLSSVQDRFREKNQFIDDAELERRAIELGRDPSFLCDYAKRWGDKAAFRLADRITMAKENHRLRFPQLVEFSESCRTSLPIPGDNELSPLEIGIRGVIAEKIKQLKRPTPTWRPLICELPIVAFPAALRLWPGERMAVLLTSSELREWRARTVGNVNDSPRPVIFRWQVEEVSRDFEWSETRQKKKSLRDLGIDQDVELFLFTSMKIFHPRMGFTFDEVWAWNSKEFKFIKRTSCSIF